MSLLLLFNAATQTIQPGLVNDLAVGGDPYFGQVVLLSNFEFADQTASFADQTARHTITGTGGGGITFARISTTEKEYGAAAFSCGNTVFGTVPAHADWVLSRANSDQFTIETSIRCVSYAGNISLLNQFGAAGNRGFLWRINGGAIEFFWSPDGTNLQSLTVPSGTASMTPNTFIKLCVEKDAAGKFRIYKNGVMLASSTPADSTWIVSTADLQIGPTVAGDVNYGDNLRITKGVARYANDAGYTPATAEFPTSGIADAFYAPVVLQPLSPALVVDTDTFASPAVIAGEAAVAPALVLDAETFFAPAVTTQAALAPALVVDTETFHAPAVLPDRFVVPGLVVDADAFLAPVVAAGAVAIVPGLVVDAESFYAPTIAAGALALAPARVVDAEVFYAPSVVAGAVTLLPGLVVDVEVVFAPTITQPSDALLLPGLVLDADAFYVVSVGIAAYTLLPALVLDADVVPAPAVAAGAINLFPDRVPDFDVVYAPALASGAVLQPGLVLDPFEQIIAPSVVVVQTLQPLRLLDDDSFAAPVVIAGSVTVQPPLVISPDVFYVPFVANQGQQGGGGGGGGGNSPKDIKYASSMVMQQPGLIIALGVQTTQARTIGCRMAIYAAGPGARLGVSTDKTSVVLGDNTFPLITPVAVLAGQTVWIAFQGDATLNWLLQNVPQGSRFNNDLFADGISNPFGPSSNDNKKAPLFAIYLQSAPATIAPERLIDADAFLGASILKANEVSLSLVIADDAIWPPALLAFNEVQPPLLADDDSIAAPAVSTSYMLLPGLFIDSDIVLDPAMNAVQPPDRQVSTPILLDADEFYPPDVIPQGAVLDIPLLLDEDQIYETLARPYAELFDDEFLDDHDDIPAPEVLAFYALDAALYVDIDLIEPPEVIGFQLGQTLAADLFVDDDVIFPLQAGHVHHFRALLHGSRASDADIFGSEADAPRVRGEPSG